jgi:hypothetical protein
MKLCSGGACSAKSKFVAQVVSACDTEIVLWNKKDVVAELASAQRKLRLERMKDHNQYHRLSQPVQNTA